MGAAAIGAIGAGVSLFSSIGGLGSQKGLIEQKQAQEQIASSERTQRSSERARQILGQQAVLAAARGLAPSSGSVRGLASGVLTKFNEDEHANALNLSFKESALQAQLNAIQRQQDILFPTAGIAGGFGLNKLFKERFIQ